MTTAELLLWTALPYACVAVLVSGLVWRYRYDRFGWSTRSSQMYESRIMKIASPLFHYGIIAVFLGHVLGLMVPQDWTEAFGIDEHTYHLLTMPLSLVAGLATVVGLVMLIIRRRSSALVFQRTTRNDKVMYVFLGAAVAFGIVASWYASGLFGEGHNYREDVSVWFRSILIFQPQPEHMASAPLIFQLHVVAGFVLFAVWPFTRLVHALSAPLQYVARPYVVYRKRDSHPTGSRAPRRGWEPSRRD
ncbi:MAG: respiratory nitrate reductase subunit gamma [Actinomycetes bacterium]